MKSVVQGYRIDFGKLGELRKGYTVRDLSELRNSGLLVIWGRGGVFLQGAVHPLLASSEFGFRVNSATQGCRVTM